MTRATMRFGPCTQNVNNLSHLNCQHIWEVYVVTYMLLGFKKGLLGVFLYRSSPCLSYVSGCNEILATMFYIMLFIMENKCEVGSSHNKATYLSKVLDGVYRIAGLLVVKKPDVCFKSMFARIGKHMVHLLHLLLLRQLTHYIFCHTKISLGTPTFFHAR